MSDERIQSDRPGTDIGNACLPSEISIGGVVGAIVVLAGTLFLAAGTFAEFVLPRIHDLAAWCAVVGLPLLGIGVTLCLAAFSRRPARLFALGLLMASAGLALSMACLLIDARGWTTGPDRTIRGALFGLPLAGPGVGLAVLARSCKRISWMFVGGQFLAAIGFLLNVFGGTLYVFALFPENLPLYLVAWCVGTGLPLLGGGMALSSYALFGRSRPILVHAQPVVDPRSEGTPDKRALTTWFSGFAIAATGTIFPLVIAFLGLDPLPWWSVLVALLLVCVGVVLCVRSLWIGSR
jgi:hypothetical protein